MQKEKVEQTRQIQTATAALQDILGDTLLAIYLHGSMALGKPGPQSDIDLLAIVNHGITNDQRHALLKALLHISGHHPAVPGGPRCVEVIIFCLPDLSENHYPPRAEFTYGEWLRATFEAGAIPLSTSDPEYALLLAQARREAIPLTGPCASALLPPTSLGYIHQAMRDALPALLAGLSGDERNALLTLARMWHTATTGEFVPKDTAAIWAIPQMPDQDAATLDYARRSYLGEIIDEWSPRHHEARRLADHLHERIIELL